MRILKMKPEQKPERVIAFHDVQVVLPVQHCKTERTLNLFGHVTQAAEVEGFHLFDELDCNIAICLNVGSREFQGLAKQTIIVESPVMSQRKGHPLGVASERVIILRLQGRPLSSHTGLAHHNGRIPGDLSLIHI